VLWCAASRSPSVQTKTKPSLSRSFSLPLPPHCTSRPFLSTPKNPRRPIRQTHPDRHPHLTITHFSPVASSPPLSFFVTHLFVVLSPFGVASLFLLTLDLINPPLPERRLRSARPADVDVNSPAPDFFTASLDRYLDPNYSSSTARTLGSPNSAPRVVALSGG
jgi:hypothetical protein